MLQFRAARADELDTCATFWQAMYAEVGNIDVNQFRDGWRERFTRYFSRRMSEDGARWFVCDADGGVVGSACALVQQDYPSEIHGLRFGYILGVRVAPEMRKRGIARALAQACVEYLRDKSCHRISLHASPMGRPIYEAMGFERANEYRLPVSAP